MVEKRRPITRNPFPFMSGRLGLMVATSNFGSASAAIGFSFDGGSGMVHAVSGVARVRFKGSGFGPCQHRQELTRRGCTIPQAWGEKTPTMLSKVHLFNRLNSAGPPCVFRNRTSIILILRNASVSRIIELTRQADIDRLQSEGGARIGY